MAQPDYDWEMDTSLKAAVSCVSLGSYCAVAAALNHLKLRTAAYPFDWNRTTIEGVIHFLENRFSDFLNFLSVKDFPGGLDTGGKTYCGAHHSVWHEDLATEEGNQKYQRRICRFYENSASRKLFIRSMNTSSELVNAVALLQTLQNLFSNSQVYLLLIAPCQMSTQSFVVDGTAGRLLVHCIPQWSVDGMWYTEPIRAAYLHAATCDPMQLSDEGATFQRRSLPDVFQAVKPYWGGLPQQVPFSPQLLYVPQPYPVVPVQRYAAGPTTTATTMVLAPAVRNVTPQVVVNVQPGAAVIDRQHDVEEAANNVRTATSSLAAQEAHGSSASSSSAAGAPAFTAGAAYRVLPPPPAPPAALIAASAATSVAASVATTAAAAAALATAAATAAAAPTATTATVAAPAAPAPPLRRPAVLAVAQAGAFATRAPPRGPYLVQQ